MKFLAEIHGYPPHHNSGAEWMAHAIFKRLVEKGHEVTILLNFNSYLGKVDQPYEFEGVKIVSDINWRQYYVWTDFVITHLDKTGRAYNRARAYGKKLFHFIHNNHPNVVVENMNGLDQYCIYNTNWIMESLKPRHKYIKGKIVVHPPVFTEDYSIKRINDYISLINVNINKGGKIFQQLARDLPGYKFMGVIGSYGEQQVDHTIKNINYVNHTPDIKQIYKRTRILLMPSSYESYGRTAVEAGISGIPVICTPTPGLKEALGDSGIYVELDNYQGWIDAIKNLDNKKEYNKWSKKIFEHTRALNPYKEIEDLIKFIENENKNN